MDDRQKSKTVAAIIGTIVAGVLTPWPWVLDHHEALRNLALVAAGAIAVPLAIWRALVAERQAETAQRSLLNERDEKAAEMLGSPLLSVRLGGIYALQTLAAEHPPHYHLGVMRQFCAFVRGRQNPTLTDDSHTRRGGGAAAGDSLSEPVREDVRAVMDAIAARSAAGIVVEQQGIRFRLDLRGANLREWRFSGANLSGVIFIEADLSGADLSGADLSEANLFEADLSGANPFTLLLARTDGDAAALSAAIQRELRRIEPDVFFFHQGDTLRETAAAATLPTRVAATVASASGIVALVLGAIGLYGVVAYLVLRRTREFAVRSALGAGSGTLLRLVLATGARVAVLGAGAGVVLTFAMTGLASQAVPGGPVADPMASVADPVVWAGVLLLVVGVTAAAHVGPARRILRLDLARALHVE